MISIIKIFFLVFLSFSDLWAKDSISFNEVLQKIETHPSLKALSEKGESFSFLGKSASMWDYPGLSLSLKNQNLGPQKLVENPMANLELSIQQKIPLTVYKDYLQQSFKKKQESLLFLKNQQKRQLLFKFWLLGIEKFKLQKSLLVLDEEIKLQKQKINGAEILIQSHLETEANLLQLRSDLLLLIRKKLLKQKKTEILAQKLIYFTGKPQELDLQSFNWGILREKPTGETDFLEKSLEMEILAGKNKAKYLRLVEWPDLKAFFSYIQRFKDDDLGNFFSLGLSYPLSLNQKNHAKTIAARHKLNSLQQKLLSYQKEKRASLAALKVKIAASLEELEILGKSLELGKKSRNLSLTYYSQGKLKYFQLINSEEKLQKLRFEQIALKAQLNSFRLKYKYLKGEKLHD